jgi:phage replication-related protein YjqB (UPF0714/DUF867 family)
MICTFVLVNNLRSRKNSPGHVTSYNVDNNDVTLGKAFGVKVKCHDIEHSEITRNTV